MSQQNIIEAGTGNPLGNFKKLEKQKQHFIFYTTHGTAEVTVYTPSVFRVVLYENQPLPVNPYTVVLQPQQVVVHFENAESEFIIQTDSLTLRINKFPLRFSFFTPQGKEINSDDSMGTYWTDSETYVIKKLQDKEKFLGLGEKTGHMNRRGHAYTHWNTDNPHYMDRDDPIYSSIPFYLGFHHGLHYGIYLDKTCKTRFNFGAGNNRFAYFSAESKQVDYYFIYHTTVPEILNSYAQLTGTINLPPIWGLGFQQCRWSYTPDTEVLDIATKFRHHNIPIDVLYLDIDYMDGYKVFTWHPKNFSNPKRLTSELKKMGIHTMVIIDPGIKIEKGYSVYDEGVKKNYFLKYPDGTLYEGEVWPGLCHFPDFTDPEVRSWWGKQFKVLVDAGVTGFWNDMNEIAVWGKDVPPMVRMHGEGSPTTYAEMKNVYGMQMARATYEGTKKLLNNKRPLVLTRSGFAGLQRYTAIWTGDNHATDDHMMLGIRLVSSLGLSGVPFAGYDVGGFNGDATPELYARWVSLGTFSPFFRAHSAIGTKRAEPWSFGEHAERIAKRFIKLRYNLLPYIYSLFFEASQTGMPLQRSLVIDYPNDERTFYYKYENQYLFGPSFLIAPSPGTAKITEAFLPKGKWYGFFDGSTYEGNSEILIKTPLEKPAVFVKESAIIPVQRQVMNTAEQGSDTLEIHIYKGSRSSSFTYYEDDGTSYEYLLNKKYVRTINYVPKQKQIVFEAVQGNYTSKFRHIRLQLHHFGSEANQVTVNGKTAVAATAKHNFLYHYQRTEDNILSINFKNTNNRVVIEW